MIPEAVDANGFPNYTVTQRGHHVRLATYNGTNIKFYEARNVKDKWIDSKFYIVDVPSPTIVGLPLSDQLNIVELHCDITTQQNSVTNTLPNGQLPETSINSIEDLLQFWIISTTVWPYIYNLLDPAHLHVKVDATSHSDPPRQYSIHLILKLQEEINKILEEGMSEHKKWLPVQ